jgi:O-acetyl-ADP-ribose deacetylase (regulator of RNase III)
MSVFFDGRLVVATGDITSLAVDAIVNAANSSLMGGGGVDGAIHSAGGPAIFAACQEIRKSRYPEGLPAGEAVETTAGKLRARYVIHTVGPVWHGGTSGEEALLASCYLKCLELAGRLDVHTMAFPAISTGVYGYPKEKAAELVWRTLTRYFAMFPAPQVVTLMFFSRHDERVFLQAAGAEP